MIYCSHLCFLSGIEKTRHCLRYVKRSLRKHIGWTGYLKKLSSSILTEWCPLLVKQTTTVRQNPFYSFQRIWLAIMLENTWFKYILFISTIWLLFRVERKSTSVASAVIGGELSIWRQCWNDVDPLWECCNLLSSAFRLPGRRRPFHSDLVWVFSSQYVTRLFMQKTTGKWKISTY